MTSVPVQCSGEKAIEPPPQPFTIEQALKLLQAVAVLTAVVYGLGWLCESTMYRNMSIGIASVSHEVAIAGGISALVCLAPALVSVILLRRVTSRPFKNEGDNKGHHLGRTRLYVGLVATLIIGPAATYGALSYMQDKRLVDMQKFLFPHMSFSNMLLLDLAASVVLVALIAGIFLTRDSFCGVDNHPSRRHILCSVCALILPVILVAKTDNFVNNLLPCLAGSFGGFYAQNQYIGIEDATNQLSAEKLCTIPAFILTKDAESLVFVEGYIGVPDKYRQLSKLDADNCRSPGGHRIISVPLKRIVWMREPVFSPTVRGVSDEN